MRNIVTAGLILIIAGSCINPNGIDTDRARADILLAEKEFAKMAADSGIARAFLFFAADDAVILRGDKLVPGIENIRQYFSNSPEDRISLEWAPDFVDVSTSGDLGYTYGRYLLTQTDSAGQSISSEGYFHTVWKKQPDGIWKFVWD
ncbi:MAG: DUF4440 domain-containing protein [Bacteroidia bacterium]|nr:MAG: DUF4440 domain-containing protein [Bacteroidia bacterium]